MKDYQIWVKKNEKLFEKHAPPGWKYRGSYSYVLGFGRFHAAWLWESQKYGDFDALREHNDETWIRLSEEASDFFTSDPGEAVLLREIGVTRIIEPRKK